MRLHEFRRQICRTRARVGDISSFCTCDQSICTYNQPAMCHLHHALSFMLVFFPSLLTTKIYFRWIKNGFSFAFVLFEHLHTKELHTHTLLKVLIDRLFEHTNTHSQASLANKRAVVTCCSSIMLCVDARHTAVAYTHCSVWRRQMVVSWLCFVSCNQVVSPHQLTYASDQQQFQHGKWKHIDHWSAATWRTHCASSIERRFICTAGAVRRSCFIAIAREFMHISSNPVCFTPQTFELDRKPLEIFPQRLCFSHTVFRPN